MKKLLTKINQFRDDYNILVGKRNQLQDQLRSAQSYLQHFQDDLELETHVLELLYATSKAAKNYVRTFIENICSEMLTQVYEEKHTFVIEVIDRRGKHECDYFVTDKSTTIKLKKPFIGKGGGKVTLIATTLRLAVIELLKLNGTVFLDEPLKMVDGSAAPRFAEFLKQYSEKFNRQIIVVTHNNAIVDASSTHYNVTKTRGISTVRLAK